MTTKTARKPDNPEQYARFLETARKVDAAEDPEAFDKAVKAVISKKVPR